METKRRISNSLCFSFNDLPHDGIDIEATETFKTISEGRDAHPDLEETFRSPIIIHGKLLPVASKLDIRGNFSTEIESVCDRCAGPVHSHLKGDFSTFLMPESQFSEHDKPGGKVIHGSTKNLRPSRHHSRSKAPKLSDAKGEHEDMNFGAFDGDQIDLRPLIREHLILQLPMNFLCTEDCRGLCLRCGENINEGLCQCSEGPQMVETVSTIA